MDSLTREEKRKKSRLLLANVYNLPAMSRVMLDVSKLLDDPSTNTQALSGMIGKDQGLATKLLSIANSPLYGLPRKVSTIEFAILIIGYQDIKNIVVALSMIESFKNKNDKNLDQKEFWLHSLIVGNAAKRLAEDLGQANSGECFVAGLLHDLGIPVIHKYFHSAFMEILRLVGQETMPCNEAELSVLGLNHQEIGKYLAEKWNLPSSLCDAIEYHHEPAKGKESMELSAIVHLADYMTQRLDAGKFYWDEGMKLDESIMGILKFSTESELEKFILSYEKLFKDDAQNAII